MGTLIAWTYPTTMFGNLADHTYVSCGTQGKAWGCWGGKSNGTVLASAPGSTIRADAIAEPNERAGITCYLINGVCHQAANRILSPAAMTVAGAKGYSLSVAIFGTYGRPRGVLGACAAPFHQHTSLNGDLPECAQPLSTPGRTTALREDGPLDYVDSRYMSRVWEMYRDAVDDPFNFQIELFKLFVEHKYQRAGFVAPETFHLLMLAREKFERLRLEAEEELTGGGDSNAFVSRFDSLTLEFQSDLAGLLSRAEYVALLGLAPNEPITLSDPDIVKNAFRAPPRPGGRSP